MDDCLKSVPTVKKAVRLTCDLMELCSKGGFQLTKWVSNSKAMLSTIKEEDRGKDLRSLDLEKDQLPTHHALGLLWSVEENTFRFDIKVTDKLHTRRGILSVYDPLGFLAPLTLPVKQLLQELRGQRYGWDEPIPIVQSMQWVRWIQDLHKLNDFSVPHCIKPNDFGRPQFLQLHHFADAGESGYGTVSYLRMINAQCVVHVSFMAGKARVAPLKQHTTMCLPTDTGH